MKRTELVVEGQEDDERLTFKHNTMLAGRHDDGSVRTMNSGGYSQGIE